MPTLTPSSAASPPSALHCVHASSTLHCRFGIAADKIILYGQSIGTVPTVDLASRVLCAGVVLHSPLASGLRVLRPSTTCNLCCDPFPSITKISRIKCSILVIHGLQACSIDVGVGETAGQDDVIPVSHSHSLLEHTQNAVEPLFIPEARSRCRLRE